MAASLLTLQRTHGNRFVQRLLNGAAIQRECACGGTCSHCQKDDAHPRDHDFNGIPLTPPARGGSVEELDESAFAVGQGPAPAPPVSPPSPPPPTVSICDTQLPTGETTNPNGWGSGNWATAGRWRQQLKPTGTNFSGCQVTEADPGGGTDGCWFSGSAISPQTGITGGTWTVGASNFWGDDFVGWGSGAVTYYRNQGRAPCSFSWPQSMRIVRPGGNVQYVRNRLLGTIGTTTVSSSRAGVTQTKNWP